MKKKILSSIILTVIILGCFIVCSFTLDRKSGKSNNREMVSGHVDQLQGKTATSTMKIYVLDRAKVNLIVKENGLDSALRLLGYQTGGSLLGFFDKQLLNELFASVSTSAPSNSILNFIYEYYQYPDINKEQYKSVFKTYYSNWINHSKIPLDENSYESFLAVMVGCGGVEMQNLINDSFHYWVHISKHLKHKIDEAHEDANTDLYKKTCQNAYFAQCALKQLNSSHYKEHDLISYKEKSESNDQVPNFNIEKFESYSIDKYAIGESEKRTCAKSITSLNDLLQFNQKDVFSTFDLKMVDGCNNNTTIFVNKNVGYILDISDCDDSEEGCEKCHQFGSITSIKMVNSTILRTIMVGSWG